MFLKTLKIEPRCVELINFMELFYFGVVFTLVNSLTTRAQYSVKRKLGKTCKIIYFLLFMYLLLFSTPIVFIICTVIIKMVFFNY
jgi:chromate transport protein ChrA